MLTRRGLRCCCDTCAAESRCIAHAAGWPIRFARCECETLDVLLDASAPSCRKMPQPSFSTPRSWSIVGSSLQMPIVPNHAQVNMGSLRSASTAACRRHAEGPCHCDAGARTVDSFPACINLAGSVAGRRAWRVRPKQLLGGGSRFSHASRSCHVRPGPRARGAVSFTPRCEAQKELALASQEFGRTRKPRVTPMCTRRRVTCGWWMCERAIKGLLTATQQRHPANREVS